MPPRFVAQTLRAPPPGRIVESFHIDRRALVDHGELDLTEDRIRGAIKTLETIGYLDRAVTSGSKYKQTENVLHRKAIRYQFGSEYFPLFDAANKRAAAARGRRSEAQRTQTGEQPSGVYGLRRGSGSCCEFEALSSA
jgi:hypothetical protein